jgi:alanine racemase
VKSNNKAMRTSFPMLSEGRPTWAEINLDNLVHNFLVMKQAVGASVAVMPVVKADAYGHGAVRCAIALERAGADWFGVATPEEAVELRRAGIRQPILCLGGFWEGQEEMLIAHELTPAMFRLDLLERFDQAARAAGRVANYHLKVDTGMGRCGVPHAELGKFLDHALRFENAKLDGMLTHFAAADEPDKIEFTMRQMARFEEAVEVARARSFVPTWIHQANTAAALAYPGARGNMIRTGGAVYGLWRDVTNPSVRPLEWRPVMSLHTRIMLIRTVESGAPLGYGCTFVTERASRIAILPIGYEDGLRRSLSNRGRCLVRGRPVPIVGRVSMDLTIIDVTDVADASVGDEVIIIGRQGEYEITAEELAAQIGTISYEVTCGISRRVPRIYVSSNK